MPVVSPSCNASESAAAVVTNRAEQQPSITSPSDTEVDVEKNGREPESDPIEKRLTLSFRNLTVKVTAADEGLGETLWSRVDPTQLKQLFSTNNQPMRVSEN